jgi:hypothetical protein
LQDSEPSTFTRFSLFPAYFSCWAKVGAEIGQQTREDTSRKATAGPANRGGQGWVGIDFFWLCMKEMHTRTWDCALDSPHQQADKHPGEANIFYMQTRGRVFQASICKISAITFLESKCLYRYIIPRQPSQGRHKYICWKWTYSQEASWITIQLRYCIYGISIMCVQYGVRQWLQTIVARKSFCFGEYL